MNPDTNSSDFDDEMRRLWQAAPAPEAPSSRELRAQLAGRRRRVLRQQATTLAALLLAPPAMLWVCLTQHLSTLAIVGLLLAGLAVLSSIWRQLRALRLFYTLPAQDAPPAYLARLRSYYQWQQRYGLRFYQGYIVLLNAGLAMFFWNIYQAEPGMQLGLVLGLTAFTALVLMRYSRRHATKELEATAQVLSGLEGFEG